MGDIDIKQIMEQFPDCMTDGRKLKAILLDTYPNEPKAIINTLVIIVDSGIAQEIKNNLTATELEKSKWKKRLENDYGLSEKIIDSGLKLFLCACQANQRLSSINKVKTTSPTRNTIRDSVIKYSNNLTYANNNISVGSIIKFGSYWQDESTSAGKTPIEWRVLAKNGNLILIISEKALDCQKYNSSHMDTTWKTCSLRSWLNETFLNSAFTTEDQSIIIDATISVKKNPNLRINHSNATKDKIFLLSDKVINIYFGSDSARKCVPTAYAKANGVYTSSSCTKGGEPTCWWYLRSSSTRNTIVSNDGSVHYPYDIRDNCFGVRPALLIDLSLVKIV